MTPTRSWVDVLRAGGALVLATLLLVGIPVALVVLVGNPLPAEVPSMGVIVDTVAGGRLTPSIQIDVLAAVAWLLWANLGFSFAVETVAAVRGRRSARRRPLAATQWLAARLVGYLALLGSVALDTGAAASTSLPPLPVALATTDRAPADDGAATTAARDSSVGEAAAVDGPTVRAGRRDTLWSLAESHLGQGEAWRALRDANVGRTMPDGTVLAADFTQVRGGWVLQLPSEGFDITGGVDVTMAGVTVDPAVVQVEVVAGDNLWNLSEERLVDADRPADDADVLAYLDDVIDRNDRLIDDPDLIHPGQVFELPDPTGQGVAGPASAAPSSRTDDGHVSGEGPDHGSPISASGATSTTQPVPTPETTNDGQTPAMRQGAQPAPESAPETSAGASSEVTPPNGEMAASSAPAIDGAESAAVGVGRIHGGPTPASGAPSAQPSRGVGARTGAAAPTGDRVTVEQSALASPVAHLGSVTLGAAAALLASGGLRALRRRRRYRLAHRAAGTVPAAPDPDLSAIERALHRHRDDEAATWVRAAVDSLGARPVLAGEAIAQPVTGVIDAEQLTVCFDRSDALAAPLPWSSGDEDRCWQLPLSTSVDVLPSSVVAHPVPALVTIGVDVLVNLEALGVLAISGAGDEPYDLVRSLVHELATSPGASRVDIRSTVLLAGTEAYGLVRYQPARALGAELAAWLDAVDERLEAASASNAYALRLLADDDPPAPVVAVLAAEDLPDVASLMARVRQARFPVAVLVVGEAEEATHRLVIEGSTAWFEHEPEHPFQPQLLSAEAAAALGALLADAADAPYVPLVPEVELSVSAPAPGAPAPTHRRPYGADQPARKADTDNEAQPPVEESGGGSDAPGGDSGGGPPRPFEVLSRQDDAVEREAETGILVGVLGPVEVQGVDADLTSQQLSVLAYLACHGPVSRVMLIEALWDGQIISESRLPNLLTELRARVGRHHLPEAREGRYELAGVDTDLARFERRLRATHRLDGQALADELRVALSLVRGVPLTPPSQRFWSWVTDESHLAVRVEAVVADTALRLANLERAQGRLEEAEWACQQGLLASPTDESLVVALTEIYVARGQHGAAVRLVEGWEDRIGRLDCGEPSDEPRRRLSG